MPWLIIVTYGWKDFFNFLQKALRSYEDFVFACRSI